MKREAEPNAPNVFIQGTNRCYLFGTQVKVFMVQVLNHALMVVALGNNGNIPLRSPAQKDLRRSFDRAWSLPVLEECQ